MTTTSNTPHVRIVRGAETYLPTAKTTEPPTCEDCRHPLSAHESVRRGVGPVCARRRVLGGAA